MSNRPVLHRRGRIHRIGISVMLVLGILSLPSSASAAEQPAVFRVNAGGAELPGTPAWTADTGSNPSSFVNAAATGNKTSAPNANVNMTHPSLPAGTPVDLFKTERWDPAGDPEMKWSFPVTEGAYEARLYFAETYSGTQSVGARVFDVSIEGGVVLNDYDIFADVGGHTAVMKSFIVSSDSSLDIELGHVTENPAIKGIEILPAAGAAGELAASPTSLSFGSVNLGATKEMSVNLTNLGATGDPDIVVEGTDIGGSDPGQFSDDFNDAADVTLSPGESTPIAVDFAPTTKGAKSASLDVAHNGSNIVSVSLAGSGNEVLPGAWQTLPSSSIDRQEVAHVQVDGRFYLAGGLATGATAVEMYDPIAETWTTVGQMPEALDHIQAVAIGTKIYLIGGLNNWPADDSANVYIYDTETDDFTEGAPMPNARERGAGGVAVHNGKIYYAGGLHDGAAVNWFDVYDPVTDDWSALSDMPNGRDHFQAAVLNGKFYAIGGRNQAINAFVNVNQAYDFSTGQWAAGLAPLPTARGGFATAVLGDEIIVMGGEGGGKVFSEVEAYKPSTNTWRSLAPMTTARHGIQAAVCNDGIYLAAGGETQGGGTPGNVHDVFFLNGATTCSPPEQTGALGASPTNFGFGHVPVGSTKDQTIQLTNLGSTGDADIVVDSTTMEGIGADQFQDSFNDAGDVTLSPGESTTFQATFAPTNTGSKAATLKVNHDGSNSPVDIDLTGTSTAGGSVVYRINAGGPPVDDLPSGWAADTTAAPAAQVNTGSNTFSTGQNINMTHASIPAGTPQAVFKDERYDPVGDPSMQWDFPVAPGDYEVRLYFAELFLTGAGQRLFDVNIEGITALKNYDIVAAAGAPKKGIVETFMVSSDGNLDIDFLRAVENPTVTAIEIREISADAPGDPGVLGALPTSVGFGDTAVDSTKDQTIQVTNLGGLGDPAIVVDNTTIEGANAGQFQDSFNDAGDVTLAPGESTTFQATFAPTAAGNKTATLKVHHDGSNNPISIDLSAIATDNSGGTVLYRINSGGPAVGDLPVGWAADTAAAPAPQVNSGNTASGTGQAIDVTHGSIPAGTPPTLFKDERYDQAGDPDMQWDFPVTAGDYEVRLYFAELFVTGPTQRMFDVNIEGVTALKNYDIFAAAGGAKKGIVETFMVSSDANLDIDFLRGVENPTVTAIEIREMSADAPGDPGALGALPTNVGFANTAVGATKDQSIQLTNLGSAGDPDIVVGSTTIEGADADQFEDSFNDAGDVTLSPGESTTFQATFAPTTAGSKAATLKVHHDGSNSPVDIDLTGTSTVGGAIVYRINAGGPLISDVPLGWAADTAAAPAPQVNTGNSASATGQAIDMSHSSIPPGTPAAVFKDERFDQPSDPNMQWDFPVSPGDYEVRLFFAELFVNAPSQRSFDVKIEGATALKNYDIFAAAGGGEKGIVETFKVSSDDNLDIDFQRGLENPTITGIEIRETHTPIVAEDAFGRTLIDSWGSADTGGAWNVLAGSAGNFDVDGAAGKIITPSGGGQQLIDLPGTSVRDVDYRANIKFAAKPNTNEHFAYLTLRRQSGGAYYRIGLVLDPTGNVAIRGQTGAGADLFDDVVAPVTYNQGDELTLRVTAHGANPTTLRAKVWKVGTEEPETWDVTDSDSTAGLQAPGSLGLRTITLSNTATTVGIDQLKAISRDGFIDTVPGATPGPTAVGFGKSTLAGHSTVMPTSLQFGPDGRLYVAQFDGTIKIYTITRNDLNSYSVTGTQTITSIQSIPNHDDNGALNAAQNTRIVTGLLVTGTAANPVIYVTSSDPRIGGHTMGGDLNLDTNSSMLSRLTWNGSQWVKLDLVRGLPRSEENHASNGLALDQSTNTLFIAQGGHTNQGATSNNFALLPEFALSAAILSVDLDQIGDTTYDIPTLDDETQAGTNDATDPFGGNDGKNQAKIVPGGPVQVYSPGFRNPYDIEITKSGKMYTIDNGGNAGWGAPPVNEGPGGTCTNGLSEPGVSDPDALHLVTPGYYGGHPNPTRANKSNTFNSNAQSPVPTANPIECDYRKPGTAAATDLTTFPSSTNGIDEYTASNFGEAMKGNLLSSGYVHNTIYRVQLDPTGTEVTQNGPLFSSVGKNPLDLTAQSDSGPFPGTIWVADLLGTTFTGQIYVYEPNDYGQTGPVVICTGEDDTTLDEDADGFKNADEIANGTDPCSAGDFPPDADGDKISDLTDPDDDNDGQLDTADPFAIDETNGMGTDLPLTYTWENDEPDPGGLLKLGFTGAMTNGTSNYADLFDPEKMTASGAAGVLTVDEAGPGDALMQLNDQEYGLQFGIDANPSTTNTFTVHSRVLAPFAGVSPEDDQSMGIFIGNGDQDNYAKLVVSANGGSGGIHYVKEAGGVAVERPQAPVSVPGPSYIDLYLKVDPDAGTLQPSYSVTNGSTTGPITKLGNLGQLPTNWFSPTKGLAVGIISTSRNAATFPATWDFIEVTPDPVPGQTGNFVESGGNVIMEVEWAPPNGWTVDTEKTGYTGTSYYSWRGANFFATADAGKGGVLSYPFRTTSAGTTKFEIDIRVRRDKDGRVIADDQENDIWIKMDNGPWKKIFHGKTNPWSTWGWATNFATVEGPELITPGEYQLATGNHTLQLSARSANFKIDRIHLHKSTTNPPATTPQSPLENVVVPPPPVFDTSETPVADPEAPLGSQASAPETTSNTIIPVTYTSDPGVTSVELWAKGPADTVFVLAGTDNTPDTPSFDHNATQGDGAYAFYTVAHSSKGAEAIPDQPDATTLLDTVAPESAASSPATSTTPAITVDYSASDDASGLSEVELWVKGPSDSAYALAATDDTPAETQSFQYDATGDGTYSFYTRSRDEAGNYEAAPGVADTTTVLDTTAPVSTATPPDEEEEPVPVPITQVQKDQSATTGTSVTATLDSTPTQGNKLIAICGATGLTLAEQNGPGAGWTKVAEGAGPSGWPSVEMWERVAGASQSKTVTCTSTVTGTVRISTFEYSGLGDFDKSATSSTASATSQSTGTTPTTSVADELLLASIQPSGTIGTWGAWTNGFTQQTDNSQQSTAHRIVASTGAYSTTASWTTARSAVGIIGTWKAASSGTTDLSAISLLAAPVSTIDVGYTASDEGSGLAAVELWAKGPDDNVFLLADTDNSPTASGTFSYEASQGEGTYEFYTRARDVAGNYQPDPGAAQVSTAVPMTSVDDPDASWTYAGGSGTSGAWLTSTNSQAFGGSYKRETNAGATATYAAPLGATKLGLRGFKDPNGGLMKVAIDGDATRANLLPTAQQLVDAGTFPNTILVGNRGTLQPTDRVYDAYAATATPDTQETFASGLAASVQHQMQLTVTGYKRAAAGDARGYVSGAMYSTKPPPPASEADAPATSTDNSIPITYTADDAAASVELWSKGPSDSTFGLAQTDNTPGTPAFTYNATQGDGAYEFYTRALTAGGAREDAPSAADATTIVDTAGPTSSATSPATSKTGAFEVSYTASDDGAGLVDVELWVKGPGDGAFQLAATDNTPTSNGSFAYDALQGDGDYDFYTRAHDDAGHYEPSPANADTTTVVDGGAPASAATSPMNVSGNTIKVNYTASDQHSGLDAVELWAKGPGSGDFALAMTDNSPAGNGSFNYAATAGDGTYDFYTRALDVAGNSEDAPGAPDASTTKVPVLVVATDAFSRTSASGWGTADVGGPWSVMDGVATDFTVNGQEGAITNPSGGADRIIQLSQTSALNADLQTLIRFPKVPSTGNYFSYALLRKNGGTYYRIGPYVNAQGDILLRGQTGTGSSVFTDVATGMTLNTGDVLALRIEIDGASPTSIKAKVWKVGTTEPSSWLVTTSNNAAGLQTAGSIGLRTVNQSNSSATISFDDLNVIEPVDTLPPSSSATSSTNISEDAIRVNYTASDEQSGLGSVELWAKGPGSGSFTLAMTDNNPTANGSFDYQATAGDGTYDFYTRARDVAGNYEDPPGVPDTSIAKTAVTTLASDAFSRTSASGWGAADIGGLWSVMAGAAADFTVDGQEGAINTPSGSADRIIQLSDTSSLNADLRTRIRFPKVPSTGNYFSYALLRKNGGTYYRVGPYVNAQGDISLRGQTGSGASLFADVSTGLNLSTGDVLALRVKIEGASPTTIQAKVWKVGTSEPDSWLITESDNAAGLQTAGAVGLRTVNQSNASATIKFDDFIVID